MKSIVDGNTIQIYPRWRWISNVGVTYGNLVKVNGYSFANKEEEEVAKIVLEALLKPELEVEAVPARHSVNLIEPTYIDQEKGVMHCSVYMNGLNLAELFQSLGKVAEIQQ